MASSSPLTCADPFTRTGTASPSRDRATVWAVRRDSAPSSTRSGRCGPAERERARTSRFTANRSSRSTSSSEESSARASSLPASVCMRASSSSLRTIEIGVRRSWLASSRKARSCSSAASMRAMSSLRWRASSASSSPVSGTDSCRRWPLAATAEISSASSTRSRTGLSAAPARNQPPTDTMAANNGRPIRSACSRRCWASIASSSDVPTTTTSPSPRWPAGPASRRDCWSSGAAPRSIVIRRVRALASSLFVRTRRSRSARGRRSRPGRPRRRSARTPRSPAAWARPTGRRWW